MFYNSATLPIASTPAAELLMLDTLTAETEMLYIIVAITARVARTRASCHRKTSHQEESLEISCFPKIHDILHFQIKHVTFYDVTFGGSRAFWLFYLYHLLLCVYMSFKWYLVYSVVQHLTYRQFTLSPIIYVQHCYSIVLYSII